MTEFTRQEMDAKLASSEAKVDARLANFDASVRTGFAEMRADMARQNGQIQTQMAEMRAEMHKGTVDIIKWVIGVGLASIGAIFTVSKMTEKPPAQASAPQAPIIITIPQAAAPPAATTPAPPR